MENAKLDISTIAGLLAALILVAVAIAMGGAPLAFVDIPSVLIVIGGTFATTTACFNIRDVLKSQFLFFKTVLYSEQDPSIAATYMLDYADTARKHTILALQNRLASDTPTPFFEKGITLVIDGTPPELVDHILRQDILSMMDRHSKGVAIFRKAAEIAPAMGLIGTLIGLVQMLGHLDDPASIGPAMAVALLTTLYGAILAYMIFSPVATKLERNSKEEALINSIYLKGILSISKQENPRQLEAMINTMLPPEKRITYFV